MVKKRKINIKDGKMDLSDCSMKEDLFWATADVYCLEKHLEKSIMEMPEKLKPQYIEILDYIRIQRAKLLRGLIVNKQFDLWCVAKHFVGSVMQSLEVATKLIRQGKRQEASEYIDIAYNLYRTFWLIQEMGGGKNG